MSRISSGGSPSIRSACSISLRGIVARAEEASSAAKSTSLARALATSINAPFLDSPTTRRRCSPRLHDGAATHDLPTDLHALQRIRAEGSRERIADVPPPFRIGVMQLTMEPLDEMLATARVLDETGMDTIWLAEAYPWWRKHGMEARSSTVVSALMARETTRLTIGWGIISPFTRHPVQVAMDARVVQEAAGAGRFLLGFGTSKIFLNNARMQTKRTLGPMRDAVAIVKGVLSGERFEYDGETWSADVPAQKGAHAPREVPPVYVAATAPKMQAL